MKASCLRSSQCPAFRVPIGIPQVTIPGQCWKHANESLWSYALQRQASKHVGAHILPTCCRPCHGYWEGRSAKAIYFIVALCIQSMLDHLTVLEYIKVYQSAVPAGSFALCSTATTFPGDCLLDSR